jgi:hypothetical protein
MQFSADAQKSSVPKNEDSAPRMQEEQYFGRRHEPSPACESRCVDYFSNASNFGLPRQQQRRIAPCSGARIEYQPG